MTTMLDRPTKKKRATLDPDKARKYAQAAKKDCLSCDGTGQLRDESDGTKLKCYACAGTGKVHDFSVPMVPHGEEFGIVPPAEVPHRKNGDHKADRKRAGREAVFGDGGQVLSSSDKTIKAAPADAPELLDVAVKLIDPSPYQARVVFDAGELEALAATIGADGRLLQPPVVRATGNGRWELIDGERRWRALKLKKIERVQVIVREMSDAEAALAGLVANEQRTNLNFIERARGYQSHLERTGCTQAQLAKQLGITQGQVSNCVRLLELPEVIQKRIISGEITPTQARVLVPWAGCPPLMEQVAKELADPDADPIVDDNDLKWLVRSALEKACLEVGSNYVRNLGNVPAPKLTPQQRQECGVIRVPSPAPHGGKKMIEVATNGEAWKKLWDAQVEKVKARRKNRKKERGKNTPGTKKQATPAQRKAESKQEAEQLQHEIGRWKGDWLRELCAHALAEDATPVVRVLAFATLNGIYIGWADKMLPKVKGIKIVKGMHGRINVMASLCQASDGAVAELCRVICQEALWTESDGPNQETDGEAVAALAEELQIDLAAAWAEETTENVELIEGFLNLFDAEPLLTLAAAEWKIPLDAKLKQAAMVKTILETGKHLKCPKALLKARCL